MNYAGGCIEGPAAPLRWAEAHVDHVGSPRPRPAPLDGPVQPGVRPHARPVGHSTTRITEMVYRHELRPVLEDGAMEMDRIFPGVISDP
jgi:hypothetical protein